MTAKATLLQTLFRLNLSRIDGLVQLLYSHEPLKPTTAFGNSRGARADILRAIVVFLHATFEVALRSHIPKPSHRLRFCFYSRADLDKVLKLSGLDATAFRFFYPPLTQMQSGGSGLCTRPISYAANPTNGVWLTTGN